MKSGESFAGLYLNLTAAMSCLLVFHRHRLLDMMPDEAPAAGAAAFASPQFERPSVVVAGGGGAEAGRVDRQMQHPKARLVEAGDEEPFQPRRISPG
jgi:hypothetical protein